MSGVAWTACWSEFSIAIYGKVAYIQTSDASCTGKICLDTDEQESWIFMQTVVWLPKSNDLAPKCSQKQSHSL